MRDGGKAMGSVLEALHQRKEPRSRQGRIYPLWKLVAIVLVAAMHGEPSLRGMWRWGRAHAAEVVWRLRRWRYPGLSTRWSAVQRVASGERAAVLRPWLGEEWAYAVDGKRLRGRKRAGERALAVLTMAGQELGKVVAQRRVDAENEVAAALALVAEVPLAGTVVSADAGILHAPVVQTVVNNGGGLHRAREPPSARPDRSGGGVDHLVVAAPREAARVPRGNQQRPRPQRAARGVDGAL
ncbi:MAG: transposase family protein [Chloroflexus sp.]|uniref:transposase family protein n=1 Tax=Chloroflexus sp. TaxID=1904827 RepID=UPI0030AAA8DE